jgi:ABC-type amino acid transport system permease subunit
MAAAGIYWVMSLSLEQVQGRLERYFGRSVRNT